MHWRRFRIVLTLVIGLACLADSANGQSPANGKSAAHPLRLWYRQPAMKWVEALPLGNGRLGAMVFGGVNREQLQLNEDTLWGGGPYDPSNPDAAAALPEVRRLIFAGEYRAAQDLVQAKMMARPLREMPYQTVGGLVLDFDHGENAKAYHRELDLDSATAATSYSVDDVTYRREYFISPVDQTLVVRLTANQPGSLTFDVSMNTPMAHPSIATEGGDTLVLDARNGDYQGVPGQLTYQCWTLVLNDGGVVKAMDSRLRVESADEVVILVAAATSFVNYRDVSGDSASIARRTIRAARSKSYAELHAAHVAEHQRLFRRTTIDLGTSPAADLPTDERIQNAVSLDDPALAALYFQFARYLLISSSRPGDQAANLQGIWNDSLKPPWESKYTININFEMNYWPAEAVNLAECVEPMVQLAEELSQTGAKTARINYGARGWVAHHNTDLWRGSGPVDGAFYGMWPCGGAWVCKHLWDHYEYGQDRAYLERVYPVMKGACEFFVDVLVEHPEKGWLVTTPSHSPEHAHQDSVSICAGPTMDMQIIRDLFANTIAASEALGIDPDFREQLKQTHDKLAPNQIGAAGQLQEWLDDWDAQAPDQQHRHVSHLYGLFPSDQIDPLVTPELAAAARKSLEIRGDNATGWGIGWRINLWAALGDGERAHKVLRSLLTSRKTYPNMFDAHPPFQIDGNFGGANGIVEMLLQCRQGEIRLLPALPRAWPNGSITGLRVRRGAEIDLAWREGRLVSATLRAVVDGNHTLRYRDKTVRIALKAGASAHLDGELRDLFGALHPVTRSRTSRRTSAAFPTAAWAPAGLSR